jgi:anti-sigma28 factor (negative regulator of flagellin synthesis)
MKSLILAVALMGVTGFAYCEETLGEKSEATVNDATRSVKKGVNRVKEAACAEGDVKCLSEKAKHRAEEGTDYSKDKVKELKNDIDSDKK